MAEPQPIDEKAIAELYRRHGHAVFRRCRQLVSNEEDAHELLQEVFCQFWRHRGRFEGRASAFTYLYRIATNLSIDRLRRRTTAGSHASFDDERRAADDEQRPDRRAAATLDLAELTEGLEEETLTIAVMSHIDGLTQDEIARAMDLSRRTVGKRLKRFLTYTRKRARQLDKPSPVAPARGETHASAAETTTADTSGETVG